jgi:hypothetical protein
VSFMSRQGLAGWLSNQGEGGATGGAANAEPQDPEDVECEAPGEPDATEEQVEEVIDQRPLFRGDAGSRQPEGTGRPVICGARFRLRGRPAEPRAEERQGAVVGNGVPEWEAREWTFGIHRWAWARRACTDGYGERSGNHAGGLGDAGSTFRRWIQGIERLAAGDSEDPVEVGERLDGIGCERGGVGGAAGWGVGSDEGLEGGEFPAGERAAGPDEDLEWCLRCAWGRRSGCRRACGDTRGGVCPFPHLGEALGEVGIDSFWVHGERRAVSMSPQPQWGSWVPVFGRPGMAEAEISRERTSSGVSRGLDSSGC